MTQWDKKDKDITTFEEAQDRIEILEGQIEDLRNIVSELVSVLDKNMDFARLSHELRNL